MSDVFLFPIIYCGTREELSEFTQDAGTQQWAYHTKCMYTVMQLAFLKTQP